MTKYVLNSGGIRKCPELKRKFHREIVADLGSRLHILICSFAEPRAAWEKNFSNHCAMIVEDLQELELSFELALPSRFTQQCRESHVIYCTGGDSFLAQHWLSKYDLMELFAHKVVATNSASSQALATYAWSGDWRACIDGLGILPIKFIGHYNASHDPADPRGSVNWPKVYDELKKYRDTGLPIHALEEGRYLVVST